MTNKNEKLPPGVFKIGLEVQLTYSKDKQHGFRVLDADDRQLLAARTGFVSRDLAETTASEVVNDIAGQLAQSVNEKLKGDVATATVTKDSIDDEEDTLEQRMDRVEHAAAVTLRSIVMLCDTLMYLQLKLGDCEDRYREVARLCVPVLLKCADQIDPEHTRGRPAMPDWLSS
jgi:hypothetical protein